MLSNNHKKSRILFVIDGLEFGGGERVFLQLAKELRNRFEIYVASTPGCRFEQKISKLGVKYCPLDLKKQISLKPIQQLRKIILNEKIELIHSQGARAEFYCRIAGKITKQNNIVCTIATIVEGFKVGTLRKIIYLLLDNATKPFVKKFIVVSDYLKNFLIQKRKIPPKKIVRIYNGIELNEYDPSQKSNHLRGELEISKNSFLVCAIGRLVWEKGFRYLIFAIAEIVKEINDVTLLIVGEGPLKNELEYLAEKLRVKEKIIFAGYRKNIKEILSIVDIVVVPSILEGFPMVTLEAMAMAKPVIASNIDGIIEQIENGKDGILVPSKSPEAFAKAIQNIIVDKKKGKNLGLTAREKVKNSFSINRFVAETEKVYRSVLGTN